jgi:branched-chain amino acid transport system ATP-binding protein/urea transport system ATP-binding protein
VLTVTGLTAGYADGGIVLDGVDLQVGAGESVALLGRNGMGKTTLLRTIMGHLRPTAGDIVFEGRSVAGWPPFAIATAGIAYVPQGREIFDDFTVDENLVLGVLGRVGLRAPVPDAVYARFPRLTERRRQKAGTMSGGEQQQLAVARALAGRPRLLLLDEPTEGLQPSIVHALAGVLAAVAREEGLGLLLVEQNLEFVRALTTRCLFLENGRIVDQVATAELRSDRTILERYLSL